MTSEQVLKCFWLPKNYYNSSVSGANAATIHSFEDNSSCVDDSDNSQKENTIITESRKYKRVNNRKHIRSNAAGLPYGFAEIVNDALDFIYSGEKGCVFNMEQAIVVCSFLSNPKVKIKDEYIYISDELEENGGYRSSSVFS